jgi:hypothetical protein
MSSDISHPSTEAVVPATASVPVARKPILITKKKEGVTKTTEQKGNMAPRADPDHGRRVAPKSNPLRDLRDSFLFLRVEMPLPSSTQKIAVPAPICVAASDGWDVGCARANRSLRIHAETAE